MNQQGKQKTLKDEGDFELGEMTEKMRIKRNKEFEWILLDPIRAAKFTYNVSTLLTSVNYFQHTSQPICNFTGMKISVIQGLSLDRIKPASPNACFDNCPF